jgi:NADH-quinone oxidoreductase subunit G
VVTLTINGREVKAERGRLLIDVCEELGIFVPRFCYHPGMKSVAVCRMCLVKVEGQRKLMPACATPVDDDMKVDTVDSEAVAAQEDMLEFLLINHPLDCPICDRAGECPLQDQTLGHGPGSSRYVEPKRTFEKPIEISDLVVLDRERCVLCWRCVRFADEIAGDRFIQLVDRGAGTQILTFKDEPFDSYFSGNTIQICPVGALTAKPYRFLARPWDLKTAPSVCAYCSVGCPLTNEGRSEKIIRCQALPNENVNDFWICDKGRFGYHYTSSEDRLSTPLIRGEDDAFETATWGRALDLIAERLADGKRAAVISGGHLTTEDAFAVARLGRKVLKTNDIDSRIQDAGAPYELALRLSQSAGSTARINDLEEASEIVWAGPDPKETLPVLYLRIRTAVIDNGAHLVVVSPRRSSLDDFATEVVRCAPGEEAAALEKVKPAGERVVACWGPAFAGRDETAVFEAVLSLAERTDGKLLVCPPHAGSQGMIDMGVHPVLGPGYEPVSDPGRDTRAILEAAAAEELDALIVFGADPIADFPDARLAQRALEKCPFVVVFELFPTDTVGHADVVLPSAAYAEREGTFTNLERRLQRLEPLVRAPGTAAVGWRAAAAVARALGDDWGWRNFDDVWDAIRSEVPTHASVDLAALAQERPPDAPAYESGFEEHHGAFTLAGPGGQYPTGHRAGAPFQTGNSWPLSWELRAFEARQRPGLIPDVPPAGDSGNGQSDSGAGSGGHASGTDRESGSGSGSGGHASAGAQTRLERPSGNVSASAGPTESENPAGSVSASAGTYPEASSGESPASGTQNAAMEAGEGRPAGQAHSFVLLVGRLIYDEGAMVSRSAALRGIASPPFVEISLAEAERIGVSEGDEVVVSGGELEVSLPVRVGDVAEGAVFVPFDQKGLRANRLIDGVNPKVTVTKGDAVPYGPGDAGRRGRGGPGGGGEKKKKKN